MTRGFAKTHARFGWTLLFVSLAFGAGLETLEGFRVERLVGDPWVQRLWSLAHFHGTALGLVNLVYVGWADAEPLGIPARRRASWALRLGSVCMPLGFFLGGLFHPEGDPSFGIALAPLGALVILYGVSLQMLAAWK